MNRYRLNVCTKPVLPGLILFVFISCQVRAQTALIDSLTTAVATAPYDTSRLDKLYALSRQLVITGQYDKVLVRLDEMQEMVNHFSRGSEPKKKSFYDRLKSETARIQNLKGVVYHRQSRFEEALSSYFLALRAREELGDRKGVAMACNNIAGTYSLLSNHQQQLKYLEMAQTAFEEIGDKTGLGQTFYNLALFYNNRGEYQKALEYNIRAQQNSQEAGDKVSMTHCYLLTGSIYFQMGNYAESNVYYLKSLDLANQTGDKVGKAFMYSNLGLNYQRLHDYSNAMKTFRQSLELQQELKDKKSIADIYSQIGSLFSELKSRDLRNGDTLSYSKHIDSAFAYYDNAKRLYEEIHVRSDYTNTILKLGALNTELGRYDEALSNIETGLGISEETGDRRHRLNAYQAFSDLYAARLRHDEALKYQRMYVALKDSIMNESSAKTLLELNTRYETENKEKQIELLEKQKLIDQIELTLKNEQLHRQELVNRDKSQQLLLFSKDNEIKNLSLRQQQIALDRQVNENEKKQKEVELLQATSELQRARLEQVSLQRRFGIAGIIVLLIFGGFSYYRYKQRKKLSERLAVSLSDLKQMQQQLIETEKRREQENIRLRISRDIHDEIGSNLTKISLLSEMVATGNGHVDSETKKSVSDISAYAREVNESLSEIVWAVNPGQDTLESLLAYMRNHIHHFLEDTGIRFTIDFPVVEKDFRLDPELKRSIFLVLKEALNNALKYSQATHISVSFRLKEHDFEMRIRDDGVGFDVSEADRFGNGLHNMPFRMEQCGCRFFLTSSPGNGCEILVTGNLDQVTQS